MKRSWVVVGFVVIALSACSRVHTIRENDTLILKSSRATLKVVGVSDELVPWYEEAFRRLSALENKPFSGEMTVKGDLYEDFFQMGNILLGNWKNLLLRWAWVAREWEIMRRDAARSHASWAVPLKGEMISFCRVRDFENFFQKYQLDFKSLEEARRYLIQFLSVEVYFVSLQELMERHFRYYTMKDLPTVFFQVVVLPESVEWLIFLQKHYGKGKVRKLAREPYNKDEWAKELGRPISDIESDFVHSMEGLRFEKGVWKNLDFVHEYQQLLSLYNTSTKSTLFKK